MIANDDILDEYLPVILFLLHQGVMYTLHLQVHQHYNNKLI
jgi:hypothetical protein